MLNDTNPGRKHPWWNRNSRSDLMLGDFQAGAKHAMRQLTPDNMTNGFLNLDERRWGRSINSAGSHPRGSQFVIKTSREGGKDAWHLAKKNYLSRYLFHLDTKHLERACKHLSETVCCGGGAHECVWHCVCVRLCTWGRDRMKRNKSNICRKDGMTRVGESSCKPSVLWNQTWMDLNPSSDTYYMFLRNFLKLQFPIMENGIRNQEGCCWDCESKHM